MTTDNRITKEDINDVDFVDAEELLSDGYTVYRTVTLASTTSGTNTIVIIPSTPYDSLINVDNPLQVDDIVQIFGNAAAGLYIVSSIINGTDFTVVENIVNSAGGTADFIHPSGASKVGFDNSGTNIIGSTVQEAIAELDGYALTEGEHELLDTITHDIVENSYTEALYLGPANRLSSVTTYTDITMTTSIREQVYTYIGPRVNQVDTIQYDINGIESYRIVEVITYAGPFTNRILNIDRTRV